MHIIAEIKRASPSRGSLAQIPDPASLAVSYEAGGASAISVLTEGRRFGGSLADLRAVRAVTSLPVLRKDFIADPYQVFEARAAGADLALLIVAALDQPTLRDPCSRSSGELGMTPLVEMHTAEEVSTGHSTSGRPSSGSTPATSRPSSSTRTSSEGSPTRFPAGSSGWRSRPCKTPADVAHYRRAGADVVLVGEALVTSGDPAGTLREFLAAA